MPVAAVLAAPSMVYWALGAVALALWWVSQSLRNSGWDATWFWEDLKNNVVGFFHWLRDALSWLPWDLSSHVFGNIANAADTAFQTVLRAIEVPRNWGDTLSGWASDLYGIRDRIRDGFQAVADWVGQANYAITTGLPAMISGQIATWSSWLEYRLGQIDVWVDGTVASLTTWVNTRIGEFLTYTDGAVASVTAWVDARLGDLGTWVTGAVATVRDYVDARLGDLGTWVTGTVATVRDYVDVRFGDFGRWVTGELVSARAFVDAGFAQLRDWTTALVIARLDPVEQWVRFWQPTLDWLRSVLATIAEFLRDPWAWLFARAGRVLWPHVEAWLSRVWDGDA